MAAVVPISKGGPPHICRVCECPIFVYMRFSPCRHAFCEACGETNRQVCPICNDKVQDSKVFILGKGDCHTVYLCPAPTCGRSYLAEHSLNVHQDLRDHHVD